MMVSLPVPAQPLFSPLLQKRTLVAASLIGGLYLLFQAVLLNRLLLTETLTGSFPITYKLSLTSSVITGYFAMFPVQELFFTILMALLFGINIVLVVKLIRTMKQASSLKVSIGGVSILALASTGCPSCGLSLLSLLGPSTGVLGVTLHSSWIQLLMALLLVLSIIYSLRKLQASTICRITPLKK